MRRKPKLDTSNPVGQFYDEQLSLRASRGAYSEPPFDDILDPPKEVAVVPAAILALGLDEKETKVLSSETPPEGIEFFAWAANHQ